MRPQTLHFHSRREFCARACRAASLVAVGTVLPGCGGGTPTSPSTVNAPPFSNVVASVSGRTVSVVVDANGPLGTVGGAAGVQTSLGSFLLSRTAQDTFSVLTAICTHEGCTITGFENSQYVCPCHGSRFSTTGSVTNGPAATALKSFPAAFAAGTVTFSA